MSDAIKHKCGIAIIRLLKPLSYYKEGSTVILMEMGFFVVVGHFHEADTKRKFNYQRVPLNSW